MASPPAWFVSLCRTVFPRTPQAVDDVLQLWHEQGFSFLDGELTPWLGVKDSSSPSEEQLRACGLVQLKNGPCGLLASVWATLVRFLVFEKPTVENDLLRPVQALVEALSFIIWQARTSNSAQVVLLKGAKDVEEGTRTFSSLFGCLAHYSAGAAGSPEAGVPLYSHILHTVSVSSYPELRNLIATHISQFTSPGGILLFLWAVVLTRGVEQVKRDGLGNATLLCSGNGHCRHELVNLVLIGRATASIHDSANQVAVSLLGQGLEEQSTIGFLPPPNEQATLGSCMRWPKLPIWVVLGGAHYTVLFSFSRKTEQNYLLLTKDAFAKESKESAVCFHYNGLSSLHWRRGQTEMTGPRLIRGQLLFFDWQQETKEDLSKFSSDVDPKDMPWGCTACTFKNSPIATVCMMCTTPRPPTATPKQTCPRCKAKNSETAKACACGQPLAGKTQSPPWTCAFCGTRQPGSAQACTMCTARKVVAVEPADLAIFKCTQAEDTKELSVPQTKLGVSKVKQDGSRFLFLVQPSDARSGPPVADSWRCPRCGKDSSLSSIACSGCSVPHPCTQFPWYCSVCMGINEARFRACRFCTCPRSVAAYENKTHQTEPPAGPDESESPYICLTCSARNSPLVAPSRCGVCSSPRFMPWLAYWNSYSQLSAPSKKAAYKMLPEILFSLHILHPKLSIQFPNESLPSLTT